VSTWLGLLIVIGSVLGGFGMAGGTFGVLVQPSELVVIGGAAAGTLVIMAPGKIGKRVLHAFGIGFKGSMPSTDDYQELLKLLFHLFQVIRREGVLGMEAHIETPAESTIFKQYPRVMARHHAIEFLCDGLRQLVDGCAVSELSLLLDAEMETHHEQEHQPIALLKTVSDSLPGLGIVAAVLGIVVTMGHMDGGPEEIGHHVAAALVGTFLGILMCYGMLAPIATSIENKAQAEHRYLLAIREGILAAARGNNPQLSIEFARRSIFSDERPSSKQLAELLSAIKG
jgi:chemotaxis protein MotA